MNVSVALTIKLTFHLGHLKQPLNWIKVCFQIIPLSASKEETFVITSSPQYESSRRFHNKHGNLTSRRSVITQNVGQNFSKPREIMYLNVRQFGHSLRSCLAWWIFSKYTTDCIYFKKEREPIYILNRLGYMHTRTYQNLATNNANIFWPLGAPDHSAALLIKQKYIKGKRIYHCDLLKY